MKMTYSNEREGQLDFFDDYLKIIDKNLTLDDVISDNSDGVINGNMLEFKLSIGDLNSVLFQSIKYLSARRIKGKSIPANILLISLNEHKAYFYKSESYIDDIEQLYSGSASKNNSSFIGKSPLATFDYEKNPLDEQKMIELLREKNYTKINLDENCIVGWATRYYKENPHAKKQDFIGDLTGKVKIVGEIRNPDSLKEFIHPYPNKTNVKFNYLMDKLNDDLQKKNLGAFYTPEIYAEKSIELVRKAIERVPKGNDYVIIDRCAGTGNLQRKLTDEELSHCILSTVEYYEYKVLLELLGDKARIIIPPTEKEDTFHMGLVRGADALSQEFIENPVIKRYLEDESCTIILFENVPYAESTSIEHQRKGKGKASSVWKNSYVLSEMGKEVKGAIRNDLGNAFIWSAFKYYLRQPTDSYIVFSPVKYWKAQHLIDRKFIDGFAFNRKHFHTNINACIMVALWSQEEDVLKAIKLKAFDIENEVIKYDGILPINRVFNTYSSKYYDKRKLDSDREDGILTGLNGLEEFKNKRRIKPLVGDSIMGYLVADSSGFDNPDLHSSLLVAGRYNGNGFFLRKDNYLSKLPMFAASRYITYNRHWTERARIMKSGDKHSEFHRDVKNGKLEQFLLKCLLFTTLETQNHMRSFMGSDGRFYKNELCLDGDTIAQIDLKKLHPSKEEKILLAQWDKVLKNAKATKNYDKTLTYGVYQIIEELNTYRVDELTNRKLYDYPELNGDLNTLKSLVKEYYIGDIVPTLFDYEFLK